MTLLAYKKRSGPATVIEDRRCDDRMKVLKQIRTCHLDAAGTEIYQVGTLIDFSREGLLFASQSHDYRVGMELRVIFPQTAAECSGEVVRAETLPNGHMAVGVRILGW